MPARASAPARAYFLSACLRPWNAAVSASGDHGPTVAFTPGGGRNSFASNFAISVESAPLVDQK